MPDDTPRSVSGELDPDSDIESHLDHADELGGGEPNKPGRKKKIQTRRQHVGTKIVLPSVSFACGSSKGFVTSKHALNYFLRLKMKL
jgi:hypothetical protein